MKRLYRKPWIIEKILWIQNAKKFFFNFWKRNFFENFLLIVQELIGFVKKKKYSLLDFQNTTLVFYIYVIFRIVQSRNLIFLDNRNTSIKKVHGFCTFWTKKKEQNYSPLIRILHFITTLFRSRCSIRVSTSNLSLRYSGWLFFPLSSSFSIFNQSFWILKLKRSIVTRITFFLFSVFSYKKIDQKRFIN